MLFFTILIASIFNNSVASAQTAEPLTKRTTYNNYCDLFQREYTFANRDIMIEDDGAVDDTLIRNQQNFAKKYSDKFNRELKSITFKHDDQDKVQRNISDTTITFEMNKAASISRNQTVTEYKSKGINKSYMYTEWTKFTYVNNQCFPKTFILTDVSTKEQKVTDLDFCIDYENHLTNEPQASKKNRNCAEQSKDKNRVGYVKEKLKFLGLPIPADTSNLICNADNILKRCQVDLPQYSQMKNDYLAAQKQVGNKKNNQPPARKAK
jgi:hypothetical protein